MHMSLDKKERRRDAYLNPNSSLEMCCYELHFVTMGEGGLTKDTRGFLKYCECEAESNRRLIARVSQQSENKQCVVTIVVLELTQCAALSLGSSLFDHPFSHFA